MRFVAAQNDTPLSRLGTVMVEGVIQNWWRQGITGGAKAHYDGIVAFSQTDFTADLKNVSVPTLVMLADRFEFRTGST